MGSVCSRCRRGSTSSESTKDNNFTVEPISQRPQSSFSLHNIDVLANDAESIELDETRGNMSDDDCNRNKNLVQRISIENENASIDNVTSNASHSPPAMIKGRSSFSDCSSIVQSSSCSSPSLDESYKDLIKEVNPCPSGSEENKVIESSNESFMVPQTVGVSI